MQNIKKKEEEEENISEDDNENTALTILVMLSVMDLYLFTNFSNVK